MAWYCKSPSTTLANREFAGDRAMATEQVLGFSPGGQMEGQHDFAPGLEKVFNRPPSERAYFIRDIHGQIPTYISGSYYLNGPAAFSRSGLRYRNWLDGDGMVCHIRFGETAVYFTNRFVRTTKFNIEQEASRPVFRTFGTSFSGDVLRRGGALESPANVSVYPFHGSLLAFGEQSLPWELNPETLETVGLFNFGGTLSEASPFAAHPKFDPATGEMFNFGVFFSNVHPKLCLYCFDQKGMLRRRANYPMKYPASIHDFGLSREYLIFYISPYLVNIDAMVRHNQSLLDAMQWRPDLGSELVVFSRNNCDLVASIPIPGRYCLHLINCFEEEGRLVADVIELDRPVYEQYQPLPELFVDAPFGHPVRLIVDLDRQDLVSRTELGYAFAPDFPAVNPDVLTQPYAEFWMLGLSQTGHLGRKFFDELVHARWDEPQPSDVFRTKPGNYLGGEPIFLKNPDSEQGTIICQNFDAEHEESSFLLFNAQEVRGGPIATLRLEEPIHLGFHAAFSPIARNQP
jgi:carotenoid cleavage dioxygenase-like enzyme